MSASDMWLGRANAARGLAQDLRERAVMYPARSVERDTRLWLADWVDRAADEAMEAMTAAALVEEEQRTVQATAETAVGG